MLFRSERALTEVSNPTLVLEDLILLEYEVGDFASGQKYLDQLMEIAGSVQPGMPAFEFGMAGMVLSLTARTANNMDQLTLVESTAKTALASRTTPPTGTERAKTGLAMLSVLQNDPVAAAQYYSEFATRNGMELFFAISSDRLLGLLAQTMGNPGQSANHFEDGLAFCRKAGYRPELAWVCCDYADLLIGRNENEDSVIAKSLLDESLAISSELGMRPLMDRVAARLELTDAQPGQTSAYPDGLTRREVEVLQLICSGKTDREIAEELFISFRTVGNHVRNILNKTNTANRTEAASYAK